MKKYCIIIFIILHIYPCFIQAARTVVQQTNVSAETVLFTKKLVHVPYSKLCILGDDLYITGQVMGADKLFFYYKIPGEEDYNEMNKALSGINCHKFQFKIPGSSLPLSGLDYYLKATNSMYGFTFYNYTAENPYHLKIRQYNTAEIGVKGGSISLIDGNPYDGETSLEIKSRSLDKGYEFTIQQLDINTVPEGNSMSKNKKPVAAYNFLPEGLVLQKPARLSLLYFDLNNDGIVESVSGVKTGIRESDLKIFAWDGMDWIYLGGQNNKKKNTVSVKINQLFLFALFPAHKIKPDDIRPREKICTPNGDGINDYVHFAGLTEPFRIDIFELSGKKIRSITESFLWDGKDEHGHQAEAGPYLYQVETMIENKKQRVSGIIVIAK